MIHQFKTKPKYYATLANETPGETFKRIGITPIPAAMLNRPQPDPALDYSEVEQTDALELMTGDLGRRLEDAYDLGGFDTPDQEG